MRNIHKMKALDFPKADAQVCWKKIALYTFRTMMGLILLLCLLRLLT